LTEDRHFRADVQEGLLDIPLILLQSFFVYSSNPYIAVEDYGPDCSIQASVPSSLSAVEL
jgi:hypothetical protein